MTPKYPDESVQSVVGPDPSWWVSVPGKTVIRGSLLWAIVPYPEQKPFRLIPLGRGQDPRQHTQAEYRLEDFRVGDTPQQTSPLPVAAMPLRTGEEYLVRRGKRRPCLVMGSTEVRVDADLVRGKRWQTALTRLVVPYYSANGSATRGGWVPELVTRIRQCEYPQYFWEILPLRGSPEGSILRFDHAFSIGHDLANVEQTGYQLHPDALGLLDEWFAWYVTGAIAREGAMAAVRDLLRTS